MESYHWADTYLSQTPVSEWDIVHYISQYHPEVPKHKLTRAWNKALGQVLEDKGSTVEKKTKAEKLLSLYQETDRARAREWAPVFINNSITSSENCSINFKYPHTSDTDVPKRKRKCPPGELKEKKERKKNGSGGQRVRPLRESLRASYATMDDAKKWKLPECGEFLEDILYEQLQGSTQEHSGHSWVVDLDDPEVKRWFTDADWLHICEQMPQWLDRDPLLVNSLMRFESMKTPTDLFTILRTPYPLDEADNESSDMDVMRLKYLGPDWADLVMRLLLPLYEAPALFKSEYNLENWFNTHIWHGFLDQSMMTVKGVHLSRGESRSISCSDRKNTKPAKGSRRQTGHRYDGVLRFNDIEIGAVEHAKTYEGQNSLKWTSDSLKLVKVLHDMLVRLQLHVHSEEAFRSVSLVGLITAGLHCQPMRMKYAKGYICLVSRHELRQVPTTLEESGELLSVLLDFWGMRTLVYNCTVTLEKCKTDKRELFFRQLRSSAPLPPRAPTLPPSIETDTAIGDGD